MDEVDKALTRQLDQARKVAAWLAEGDLPDSKALGKAVGQQVPCVVRGKRGLVSQHIVGVVSDGLEVCGVRKT